jgi:hypothetical protein
VTRDADMELIVRIVLRVLDELGDGAAARPPSAPATAVAPLRLATERDVLEAVPAGVLRLAQGAVVTALAREAAEAKGVRLVIG